MSGKRNSGKKGRKHDLYETPTWVVLDGLVGFFPVKGLTVGEFACGTGKMVRALAMAGAGRIEAADILTRKTMKLPDAATFTRGDFTKTMVVAGAVDALITNPPFGEQGAMAVKFIERGLDYLRRSARITTKPVFMALLLSVDFDMAGSRVHLFEACPEYHGCIRLRRRVEWFKRKRDKATGKLGSGPSQHHAWFIWKAEPRALGALPVTMYAPSTGALL
jgi:predicted RNA methylase